MPPKKILAIKLRALGDTVLMTASLQQLRAAYPDAEIHVLVTEAWAPVLENHPAVNRVLRYTKSKGALARAKRLASWAFQLRRERYDWVINFHASPSSALLARMTSAKTRAIHFHGLKDENRYSTVEIPGKGIVKPVIERDIDVLRGLGLPVSAGSLPKVHLTSAERHAARAWLEQRGLRHPLLVIGLGASRPSKQWPVARFAALAFRWSEQTHGSALAVAGPSERTLAREFEQAVDDLVAQSVRETPHPQILTETSLSVRALAGVLGEAQVFAGNDSGPKHLAVAVGTPTVTVFGPEDPFEWHPYPRDRHPILFVPDLDCRKDAPPGMPPWCGLETCVEQKHQCMRRIPVESVFAECEKLSQC